MQKQWSKLPQNLVKKIQLKEHRKKWSATHQGLIFGVENEPVAADLYKEYLLSLPDIKEVTVQETGSIILDKDDDVLAASPDRIATIVYANGDIEYRNVEVKCLESKQDMSPETAINNHQKESSFPFIELNSVFVVKEKHKYWFQSQMQMGVSGISLTHFVTFTNNTFPVLVLKVTSSSRWEDEIKPSLIAFHEKYISK